MKRPERSRFRLLRERLTSRAKLRAAKHRRRADKHAREAERIAARTAAETRKTNPHGF